MLLALGCALPGWADSGCANCHREQTIHFARTPMARALLQPEKMGPLTFRDGPYQYAISAETGALTYTVTDGQATLSVPLLWAFGAGIVGQTWVYEYQKQLYESRVSYYSSIKGLDLTIGAAGSKPASLEMAAGRRMHAQDIAECFGCRSTGGSAGTRFDPQQMKPGVQCEGCHVDARRHEVSMLDRSAPVIPRSLRRLTAEEMNDFCGKCHRTWDQISINGPRGIANVRFQPYRLTNSKCYDAEDRRIGCTSCHDPHVPLETRAEAYDARCTACHSRSSNSRARLRLCKTGTSGCSACHMPKYEIPGSHMTFSDHHIRIVRNKQDYPN